MTFMICGKWISHEEVVDRTNSLISESANWGAVRFLIRAPVSRASAHPEEYWAIPASFDGLSEHAKTVYAVNVKAKPRISEIVE